MKKIILTCLLFAICNLCQVFAYQEVAKDAKNSGVEEANSDISAVSKKERVLYVPELNSNITIFPGVCYPRALYENRGIRKILSTNDFSWATEVLDLGTGSGILGLIVLKHGAKRAVGTDIDSAAVKNAAYNAKILGYENVFETRLVPIDRPDAYSVIKENEKFDLIISTPPWAEGKPTNISDYQNFDDNRVFLRSMIAGLISHLTEKGKALIYMSRRGGFLVFELAEKAGLRATVIDSQISPLGIKNPGCIIERFVIELKKIP